MEDHSNSYGFFAAISRMRYIERWALMRNSRPENLCEHAMEVAMIAHALCIIGNRRFGKSLNADRAAVIGLYHDASEIITGDMPTPVKYYSEDIKSAYKQVERIAEIKLTGKLPSDMKDIYDGLFRYDDNGDDDEIYVRRLVKAADKISALIKCIEEKKSGNTEFLTAYDSTKKIIDDMSDELPEVKVFSEEFLPAYEQTLDELI